PPRPPPRSSPRLTAGLTSIVHPVHARHVPSALTCVGSWRSPASLPPQHPHRGSVPVLPVLGGPHRDRGRPLHEIDELDEQLHLVGGADPDRHRWESLSALVAVP